MATAMTFQKVTQGSVSSAPLEDVMRWLKDAGVTVDIQANHTNLRYQEDGHIRTNQLPVALAQRRIVNGPVLTHIAKLCERLHTKKLAGLSAADDLPNWLQPMFVDTPFAFTLEGNQLSIYATDYPEFSKTINLNKGEAGLSHTLNEMQKQLRAYSGRLASAEEQGWVRDLTGGQPCLLPPEGDSRPPIVLSGDIQHLFSLVSREHSADGFEREAVRVVTPEEPFMEPTPAAPPKVPGASKNAADAKVSSLFEISPACPEEQGKIFKEINAFLTLFSSSMNIDDVDRNYRLALMKRCLDIAESPGPVFVNQLEPKTKKALFKSSKLARKCQAVYDAYSDDHIFTRNTHVAIGSPHPSIEDCKTFLENLYLHRTVRVQEIAQYYANKLGRFQDIDPSALTPDERKIYEKFERSVTGAMRPFAEEATPVNLLQNFANGVPLYSDRIELSWTIGKAKIATYGLNVQALHAVMPSIISFVKTLNLPPELLRSEEIVSASNNLAQAAGAYADSFQNNESVLHGNQQNGFATGLANASPWMDHNAPAPYEYIPYYILDKAEVKPAVNMMRATAERHVPPLLVHDTLFITPEAVHRAQMTGVYQPLSFSDVLNEIGSDQAHAHIKYPLMMVSGTAWQQKKGVDELQNTISICKAAYALKGTTSRLENGTTLDRARYYAEIEANSEKWVAALNDATQVYHQTTAPDLVLYRSTHAATTRFNALYLKLDTAAKTLIARHDIKFILDAKHQTGSDLGVDIEQGVIFFTPEFMNNPNFLGILREQALACALHQAPSSTAWISELSQKEIEDKHDTLPKHWKSGVDYEISLLAKARKEPELFRKLLPYSYLADHLNERHISAEAHRIRTGESPSELVATDTAFTIDKQVLTKQQQLYFGKLNELIAKLGITPEQLDGQFRLSADVVLGETMLDMGDIANQVSLGSQEYGLPVAEFMMGAAVSRVPFKPTDNEATWYQRDEKGMTGGFVGNLYKAGIHITQVPAELNILQTYASGERPMALLKSMTLMETRDGENVFTLKGNKLFNAAMHLALTNAAEKQGLQNDPLIQQQCAELIDLGMKACDFPAREVPEKVIPPAVLAQRAAVEAARAAAAKAEEERLAALEAARQSTYKLNTTQGTIAGRIERHGKADWRSAHPDAQQGILRMQHLQLGEITPLLGVLDTHLPHHQDIGDVFLSDTVLRRAEYACLPVPEGKDKAPHPISEMGQQARDLLEAWKNAPSEAMSEPERISHAQICDRLLQSPTLVVAALGNDQQLKRLRAIHHELLPNAALPPVHQIDKARIVALEAERTAIASELLAPYGIHAPSPAADITIPATVASSNDEVLPSTPSLVVQVPIATIAPVLQAPPPQVAPMEEEPQHADVTAITTPTAILAPATIASPTESEPPSLYEEWRAAQKERSSYQDAEQAALSSVYYINQQKIEQEGCRELECRLKSDRSGYSIQMTFSKNGKLFAIESLPLKNVTHIDDAMDIFLRVEAEAFGSYPQFKRDAAGNQSEQEYFVNPASSARYESHGKPERTKVNLINIQRSESYIPHGVLDLIPNQIPMVDDPNFVAQVPGRKKAFTEAKVVKTGETATLVIHSWFATEKGNKRTCSQMNIPLGVDSSQRSEAKERAAKALILMQNTLIEGKSMTPQEVINSLRQDVLAQGKTWITPKTHYAPGFETEIELNFPSAEHKQSSRLSAGILTLDHSTDTGSYYSLQFRFKIGDKSGGTEKWYAMSGRGINLHTANQDLAELRASRVMESVRELFNTTLTNGQDKKGGVQLPPNWRWDISNAREGDEYIKRPQITAEEKRRVKQQGIPVEHAVIDARNIVALVDYAIGTYADDLKVKVGDVEHTPDKTKFKIQLMRGQRDADGMIEVPSESFNLVNPRNKKEFMPVEVAMSMDNHGRSKAQIDAAIEAYRATVETSTRSKAWLDFKSTVTTGGEDIIKPRQKYSGATVANGFAAAVASNLVSTAAGADSGIAILANALNDDTRKRMDDAMKTVGSRRIKLPEKKTGAYDGR